MNAIPLGEANSQSVLTEAEVIAMRIDYTAGMRVIEIARKYGKTRYAVGDMLRGRTWRHLSTAMPEDNPENPRQTGYYVAGEDHPGAIFTTEQVLAMRVDYVNGMKTTHIARKHGANRRTVYDAVTRKTWQHI